MPAKRRPRRLPMLFAEDARRRRVVQMRPVGAGHAPQSSDLVAIFAHGPRSQPLPGTRTVLVVIDKQLDGRRQLQGAAGAPDPQRRFRLLT